MEKEILPSRIQILTTVEIYQRGNVLNLYYDGPDAIYKYTGAIFGISANRALRAVKEGYATTTITIPITF
jgi:hypothetical protein